MKTWPIITSCLLAKYSFTDVSTDCIYSYVFKSRDCHDTYLLRGFLGLARAMNAMHDRLFGQAVQLASCTIHAPNKGPV